MVVTSNLAGFPARKDQATPTPVQENTRLEGGSSQPGTAQCGALWVILQGLRWCGKCDITGYGFDIKRHCSMAAVTIRKLPEEVHAVLKRRANEKGRSTEAEIRETLISSTQSFTQQKGFGTELHEFWKNAGSPELILPQRVPVQRLVDFSGPEFDHYDL